MGGNAFDLWKTSGKGFSTVELLIDKFSSLFLYKFSCKLNNECAQKAIIFSLSVSIQLFVSEAPLYFSFPFTLKRKFFFVAFMQDALAHFNYF